MRLQLPAPSRRALLGLVSGLTVLTVTGCDLDDLRAPEAGSDPSSDTGNGGSAGPSPEQADDDLVTATRARISRARGLAAAAASSPDSPGALSTAATTLVTLHDAHLAALAPADETSGTPDPTTTSSPSPSGGGEDRTVSAAALRRSESALQTDLATNAVAAANAELAQLLASMSAAIAQQLTQLPTGASR